MANEPQASSLQPPTDIVYNSRRPAKVHGPWNWTLLPNGNDWYFDAVTVSDMPGTNEESFRVGDDHFDIIHRYPVTDTAWPKDKCPYTDAAGVPRKGGGTVRARKVMPTTMAKPKKTPYT